MSLEVFERNLKAMDKWYPVFADALRDERYEKDDIEIFKEISFDGEVIFRIKKDENLLYLNGKRNAKNAAETWIKHVGEIHKYAPVFLLGIGSGIYLKKLIANIDESVAIVAFEPSVSIFVRMLEEVDLSKEIESRPIGFVVKGLNDSEFQPVMDKLISVETIDFLKSEIHPNYRELFLEDIYAKTKEIQKRTEMICANYNTEIRFSEFNAMNEMKNMRYICEGYNTRCLSEAVPFQGPAILVSAGPSLNKNINELKNAKNKAFILAVDTAVKPLLKAGIVPDAFVTIDPVKPLNLLDMEEILDIPVIAPVMSNAEIHKRQRGKRIFYSDGSIIPLSAYAAAGKIFPSVSVGGSVACSGFSLLYKMGFNTIIFVGQDLAFTDNKSHADGTFKDVMPQEDTSKMMMVKGNYEDKVPTRQDFKMYLEWFEMYVKGVKEHRNTRVINATAGGAYIKGTEIMDLKDAIKETCKEEIDFKSCIAKIKSAFTEEERKRVIEYVHSIPEEFSEVGRNAKKLFDIYKKINKMIKRDCVNQQECSKLLKRAKKLSEQCEEKSVYQLMSMTMTRAVNMIRNDSLYELGEGKEAEEIIIVSEQGMKYAQILQECAKILGNYAKETLLTIE